MSEPGQICMEDHWKKNLCFLWLAQFISLMGFSFAIPFAPYYIQELGITSHLDIWVALFGAAPPLTMTFFAPIWGAFADRYGRRSMLLRSYIGGAVVLIMMSFIHNPVWLIVLRLMQGALAGSVTASQTLVATHTPENRSGFALGSLNSAVFSGSLSGAFFGGWTAEIFGYRTTFLISGLLLFLPATLVFFGVREIFSPPDKKLKTSSLWASIKPEPQHLAVALPILCLMAGVMFVKQFDSSFIPLLVQDVKGSLEGVSSITGTLLAVCGFAGVISGFIFGHLADKYSPGKIAIISSLCSGLFMIPLAFTTSMGLLFASRFAMVFSGGGLDPVFQIWLCKKTPPECKGLIFGWACSARSFGWMFAPLVCGLTAYTMGLRSIFICGAILYFIFIFFIVYSVRKLKAEESTEETPAMQKTGI